jgi:hypothetical protein
MIRQLRGAMDDDDAVVKEVESGKCVRGVDDKVSHKKCANTWRLR